MSVLLIGCGVIAVTYVLYQRVFSPLAPIPGPFLASLSRLWITLLTLSGKTHVVVPELHEKYGKLVRIGPNEVSVADPAAIKTMYGAGSKFRKSDWYSVWQGHRKFDLFAERNEKIHGEQRRLVSRPYSMESLRDLEEYVDDAVNFFFKRIEEVRGSSIDLGRWIQLFAFDVIGEITFSKRFGLMDVGDDGGAFEQINAALKSASWIGQVPWLFWLHDSLTPYIGNWLAINNRHGSLRKFAVNEVNARKDRGSDRRDLLSKFMAVHEAKPEAFDESAIMSMASSNIFAGSDTTAISTRAVIYHLLKNPQYKQTLIDECETARGAGKLSDPVKFEEANDMPYLQAVLYETTRVHPATGMGMPRVVPPGGFEVQGRFLPAGTVVGTNPWASHRDKTVFGQDADRFNPERWLRDDVGEMHRCFLAFGGGARLCIGKNISWMEMSKLIPTLFMRYHIELMEPDKEWNLTSYWFTAQDKLEVRLTPRQSIS